MASQLGFARGAVGKTTKCPVGETTCEGIGLEFQKAAQMSGPAYQQT